MICPMLFVRLCRIAGRECRRMVLMPRYLFSMVLPPLVCYALFTTLMDAGLPTRLPAGVVDLDNSFTSRQVVRNLDAFQHTDIVAHYPSVAEADEAMRRGDIYAFYYLPQGMEEEILSGRQPMVSFYLNYAYLVAGSLLYKDMRTLSELADASVVQAGLYARGAEVWQVKPLLQPVVVETHPIHNPWLNYSVYLNNVLLPGVLSLVILLMTVYSLGMEVKGRSGHRLLCLAKGNVGVALLGKLLPQTGVFVGLALIGNVWLYGVLHFPLYSGPLPMIVASVLLVLASQGLGVFLFALVPWMRMAMSIASLWGVVSFSISGFTFPAMAMNPALQALNNLFPLRHYFLIYTNEALNGSPIICIWTAYVALLCFALLPLPFVGRLKRVLLSHQYME